MVAIVGGSRLGLSLGSLSALGQRGIYGSSTQGRNGERAYVNFATGDLVLQDLDASLSGLGPDTSVLRTYNSHGGWGSNIDDGNGWQAAPRKYVRNLGNNTLRRYDADGAQLDYFWEESRGLYVASASIGSALDTIRVNADGTNTWTDGATGFQETYEGGGWSRIIASADTSGNTIRYAYDSRGLLTRVTMADGESIEYTYGGIGKRDLLAVTTRLASGEVVREVSYTYDNQSRMESVTVALNPTGDLPAGSLTASSYTTRYTYDGNSNRVATITQSDGSSLAFTYVWTSDNAWRVATVTDGEGQVTRFAYDLEARTTTVTDPFEVSNVYGYNADGQLTQIRTGVTAAKPSGLSQLDYTYNAIGDVTSMTDGLGNTVLMEYDANGNLTRQVDGAGNTLVRTYDARNQVLTETVYAAPAKGTTGANQPEISRYVYDAGNRNLLRFLVSPEGRVTEYRYDAQGLRVSTIQYAASAYDTSGLAATEVPTETAMRGWAQQPDLSRSERSDLAYDFRGQLQTVTTYGSVDASGNGVAATASTTTYVYDYRGLLLQTVTPDESGITQNVYDGMGRVVSSVARSADGTLSTTTVTQYDDAGAKTTVTLANGLATTSAYDRAGRLVSVMQSTAASANLGTTRYVYDADGRLLMTEDPTGQRKWFLYDAAGRKVAEVDASGGLTEYVYDRGNRVTEVIGYETRVDTSLLVDAMGQPTTAYNANPGEAPGIAPVTLESIRPAATTRDTRTWSLYDSAGRLAWQVDALGYVTQSEYDGSSRTASVTRFATAIDTTGLRDGAGVVLTVEGEPSDGIGGTTINVSRAAGDRVTTRIYDRDGLLRAAIDGEGYLAETRYDAAGEVVETIAYATKVDGFTDAASIAARVAVARASDSLEGLLPAADADGDVHAFTYYNARGQEIAAVNGEGYLTEIVYDQNGNITRTIQYANAAKIAATVTSKLTELRPDASAEDRVLANTWDALGRLSSQTNAEGTVTRYTYDEIGRITHTELALNTAEQRTLIVRYDAQGHIRAELSAKGAALITGSETQEQIDEIWRRYATTYTYDAAGRRTSSTDANELRTVFFYDEVGRLRFTVNALGEVTERTYDALGRLTQSARFDARVPAGEVEAFRGGVLSGSENVVAERALAAAGASSTEKSTTEYVYDARGEIVTTRTAISATESAASTVSYDAFGQAIGTTERIDATRTLVSTASYDRRGLRTGTVSDAGDPAAHVNATTSAQYDAFGRMTDAYDANGNHVHQDFERHGQVVELVDATGATRRTIYDAFGRVLTETDGRGSTTQYSYDIANRTVIVTTPENVTVTTVRNRAGQTRTITDGNGNTTTYEYDLDGNLTSTRAQVDGSSFVETTSTYDRTKRLVETTDANGNTVEYAYDAANRLFTRTLDPTGLNLVTSYAYDGKGQQVRMTDANGVVTETSYDLAGEVLTRVVDPGDLALKTVFTYDARGKQLEIEAPGGAVTRYVYDDLGRRTHTIVDPDGPDGLAITETYEYDDAGNVVRRTDGEGNVTGFLYDANNRLTVTVDAEGGVTKSVYDANGNVIERITYANRIDLATWVPGTPPAIVEDFNGSDQAAHDVRVRTVYDAMNRATFTLDGTGAVVAQKYDGNGNMIERIAYATTLSPSPEATETALAEAVAAIDDPLRDAHIRRVYDGLNRLVYSVDGLGSVTRQYFDGNGNLVKQVAYASTIAPDADPTSVVESGADRVALSAYDHANRVVYQVDALGGVLEQVYDAAGNVVQRIAYGTRIARPTTATPPPSVEEIEQALVDASAGAGPTRVNRAVYDAVNRMVYAVDAAGAVTRNRFDDAGNLIATIAYADLIVAADLPQLATADEIAALLLPDAASDRTTLRAYDGASRLVYTVDALGYVQQNAYDGAGRVTATTLHGHATTGLAVGATLAEIHGALVASRPSGVADDETDQVNRFTFDGAGNLVGSTDALGATESFTFDGTARKREFTNEKQQTWNYEYDAAGRLIRETNPPVSLITIATDADGDLVPGEPTEASIVNEMVYDALGNLTSRTEAVGRPEERTTSYVYDALGRQVKTIYPAVAVYTPESAAELAANGASGIAARTETVEALFTQTFYDAFGDAVASTDVAGNTSYKAYDALARVSYEIDALGYVTGYERDTFGDAVTLTRYANAPVLAASTTDAPDAPDAAEVAAALAEFAELDHAADRVITTVYDALGRAKTVTQPQAWVFNSWVFNDDGRSYLAASVVESTYDAFGQRVRTAVLADQGVEPGSDVWAITTHYFDGRGQETASVDALGYVTTQEYDAAGNVVSRTEYANKSPGWTLTSFTLPAPSGDDRTVGSTYDRGNRKVSDTRENVEYSRDDDLAADGPEIIRGDLTTTYGYDAVGNLTRTTQDLGNGTAITYTYYDALGRTIAVAAPTIAVAAPTVEGAEPEPAITPLTVFARDAYGNVLVKTEYASGVVGNTAAGLPTAAESDGDRVSVTKCDAYGHAVQMTDANGVSRFMSYDAAGRVAKQWQGVTSDDGYADGAFVHTLFTVFQYDVLGRQTAIITPASASVLLDVDGADDGNLGDDNIEIIGIIAQEAAGTVTTSIAYNAFGEMVQRGTAATGAAPNPEDVEYFDYDEAGRVWRTNAGDGNVKITLYDLLGNQTALITSAGSVGSTTDKGRDLSLAGSAEEVDQLGNDGLRRTDSKLDLLGRVETQILPLRRDPWDPAHTFAEGDAPDSGATAYRPVVHQEYDRWGNVVAQSDVRNARWITTFRYNANNQVVEQIQPHVAALDANDAVIDAAPVTKIYFDALGRQVAVRDANGNVNRQVWDAAGQLRSEIHADGGEVTYGYDAFGNRVRLTNAMGHVTTYGYDKVGNNTSIVSQADGTQADGIGIYSVADNFAVTNVDQAITTTKAYDEAGRIVRSVNGKGEATRYTFDLRGNLVMTRQPLGQTDRSAYDANGKQIASQDGNGNLSTWEYDGFGLLTDHHDFQIGPSSDIFQQQPVVGYVRSWFEYDEARQLISQRNDRGGLAGDATQNKNLHYKYDAAGQLVEIRDESFAQGPQVTRYSYNAAGKHVWEQTTQEFDPYVARNPLYQDQVLAYDSLGRLVLVAGLDGVEVDFQYDLVGNRRHQSVGYDTQKARVEPDFADPIGTDDAGTPIYGYTSDESGTYPIYEAPQIGSHIEYDATPNTQELWFAYDEMNRAVLVDGAENGDASDSDNLHAGQGHVLEYDLNGNRTSDTYLGRRVYTYQPPQTGWWHAWGQDSEAGSYEYLVGPDDPSGPGHAGTADGETATAPGSETVYTWGFEPLPAVQYLTQSGQVTEYYEYDALDRLTEVTTDDHDQSYRPMGEDSRITLEERHYDAASRVVEAGPLGGLRKGWVDAFTAGTSNAVSEKSRVSIYDANGRLVKQRTLNPDGGTDSEVQYLVTTSWVEPVYGDPIGTDDAGTPIYGYTSDDYGSYPIYDPPIIDYVTRTRTGWTFETEELVQAVNEDGTPKVDDEGNPVHVQATDGTGLPMLDAEGHPVYVQQVDPAGNPVVDADGNPVYVQQVDPDGNPVVDADGNPVYVPKLDGTGAPLVDADGNPIWKTYLQEHFVEGGYDNAGNVKAYRTTSQGVTSSYFFKQANYDGYREDAVTGYRSDGGGWGGSYSKYDANGFLTRIDDSTKNVNDRQFVSDANGRVLLKRQENRLLRQLVVDGNVLAVYGAGTDLKMPTDSAGNPRWNESQANFDLNYQPITSAYPGPSAGQYTVRGGDTLKSIAESAYGDASLWYLIANANGLRGDQDLRIGQTLIIPTRVGGAHNSADTFKPYDPSKVVGDTTPNLPVPQASGKHGCGALGIILTIVIVVVAVAVTVYTAGAASALLAGQAGVLSSLSGTMALGGAALAGGGAAAATAGVGTAALIAGAAIGGAVGSIASQGLSMAFGLQKDFSWTQVALGGLAAGVSAGVGAASSAIPGVTKLAGPAAWAVAGARAAVSSAATQGIAVLTGLQKDFSWRSVAASAVGATAGAAAGDFAGGVLKDLEVEDKFTKALVTGTISGFAAGATTAAMRGGRIDVIRVAADAFGNALANSVVQKVSESGQEALQELAQRKADSESLTLRLGGMTGPEYRKLDLKLKPGLDYSNVSSQAADGEVGQSATPEARQGPERRTAESGDSISKMLGTSDPEAIGAFMMANGLKSSTIIAGKSYIIPSDPSAFTDAGEVGQSALDRDNARLAAIAKAGAAEQAARDAAAAQAATQATSGGGGGGGFTSTPDEQSSVGGLDGPDGYKAKYRWGDAADRWRNGNGTFAQGPKRYDPIAKDGGFDIQGELKADVTLAKDDLYKSKASINLIGDGDLVTLNSSSEVKYKVGLTEKGAQGELKAVTGSELQYAKDKYNVGVGTVDATVRSAVDVGLTLKGGVTTEQVGVNLGFNAEAVALQARGEFNSDKVSLGGLVDLSVKGEGALNAGAIGGSGKLVLEYDQGRFRAGLGASASVLFGAKVSATVDVDATKLVQALPSVVNNPRYNPLAPAGQWLGDKMYDAFH